MRRTGSNILAPGLRSECFFGLTFFPPSPLFGTRAFCLCAKRTLCPLSCFSGVETPLGAQTTSLCSIAKRLACGKSYPVTAAQLLRLHTGFLAPTPCFKLAKNLASNNGLRCPVHDVYKLARFP